MTGLAELATHMLRRLFCSYTDDGEIEVGWRRTGGAQAPWVINCRGDLDSGDTSSRTTTCMTRCAKRRIARYRANWFRLVDGEMKIVTSMLLGIRKTVDGLVVQDETVV